MKNPIHWIKREKDREAGQENPKSDPEFYYGTDTTVNREPTNRETGLTASEAEERREAGLDNRPVDSDTHSLGDIVRSNVFTYFNLVFIVLALLLAVVGSFRNMMFMGVIICNTLIGIIQEVRSKKVLDDLKILNTPSARVIRDGRVSEIPTEQLVLGDLILLAAGNQIPADAVVRDGSVQVNEALLTGEADEIAKTAGSELMSGSFVVSGECCAQLTRVGAESYISRLTLQATKQKGGQQSEMMRSLDRLVQVIGILIIPIGILLFWQQFCLMSGSFHDSVTSMVAAVIGMIPEGLYLTASVALAVSAMRLAKQQVLLHDLKCIETLARVTVLCVDKTGTITENRMEVKRFLPAEELEGEMPSKLPETVLSTVDGISPNPSENIFSVEGEKQPDSSENAVRSTHFAQRILADLVQGMPTDNITMSALKEYFNEGNGHRPERVVGFSSRYKYSGGVLDGQAYIIGAPEFILGSGYEGYREKIESFGSRGYRVLAFGSYGGTLDGGPPMQPVHLMGIILLNNRIRAGASETFRYFAERKVKIRVISGDNPVSVSAIAAEAGIEGAERYIDASALHSDREVEDAMKQYVVFGRVTPEQKRQFVRVLKSMGETVAMTGDGVNDVLALKDADCSIAMASGSEAASQVSKVVLLDSDFSRMPSVVLEGRRVVNNIERTASLFLVKNIFSLLLSVSSVLLVMTYPLEASQISLITMFTIGVPAFLLSQEPNSDPIRGHFLVNVLLRALPAGVTDFAVVLGLQLFCQEFGVADDCTSTACTLLVALVGFMIMYRIMCPMTKIHWGIWLAMLAGMLIALLKFRWFFGITGITRQVTMLMILFGMAAEPAMRYLGTLTAWLERRITSDSL